MGLHVIVGAGPVGAGTAPAPRRCRPPGPDRHPPRARPVAPGRRARRGRRGPARRADRARDRRRRHLQLRQPAVPPLGRRLAADRRRAARRRRAQRRRARHHEQPLRLRAGRSPDHRGRSARRDVHQRARAGPDVERRASPRTETGRVRVTEARASDFFGPGLTDSSQLGRVIPRILAGKSVRVLGNPDLASQLDLRPRRHPRARRRSEPTRSVGTRVARAHRRAAGRNAR